ncbi:MAG TPA: MFS transporter [Chryseolinea sp.]
MEQKNINRTSLFWASCMSLLVTSLSFGIRAGILNRLGVEFSLNAQQLGTIAATAFWGFPLAVVIGGFVVDIIGMKRLLVIAFLFHLLGIGLTVFANGYWSLFLSTLLIGIANGTVEAACNPLVATIYSENKTTKLNHFHLWFPGGIVIGTLIVMLFDQVGLGEQWQWQVATMFIPTLAYGYLFLKLDFPVTERVASGVSTSSMYKSLLSPLFIFMFICMFGTAITELFTNQWVGVLLKNASSNALLLLTITTGIMVIGRAFAEPIVHRFSPAGVLLASATLAALGLYMMSTVNGNMLLVAALIFGIGVCYFWPTMLGFVSENLPKTGAVGLNLMGGAGMFAVSIYTIFMGGFYDNIIAKNLPSGADVAAFRAASAGSTEATAYANAEFVAGPEVIKATLVIPIMLVIAFIGLVIYMRGRKKAQAPATA